MMQLALPASHDSLPHRVLPAAAVTATAGECRRQKCSPALPWRYSRPHASAVRGGQRRKRKPNPLPAVLCTDSATIGQSRSTLFPHT